MKTSHNFLSYSANRMRRLLKQKGKRR